MCKSAGKSLSVVLEELGCDLSEREGAVIVQAVCDSHDQLVYCDMDWDLERQENAAVYRKFLETLEGELDEASFALFCIFLESIHLTTQAEE